MTVLYDPMWKKNLSRKDTDAANVPIQNPSVFIKDNDDWVGVISFRVSQRNPSFMKWRELSSNILKMGEARLYIALGNDALSQATQTMGWDCTRGNFTYFPNLGNYSLEQPSLKSFLEQASSSRSLRNFSEWLGDRFKDFINTRYQCTILVGNTLAGVRGRQWAPKNNLWA